MSKKRRLPAKREKAPNQKEQRRYQRELKRKRLRIQKRPVQKRPEKFPLGFGTAMYICVLGCLGIATADRMHLSFDGELAMMAMFPFIFLSFIAAPLLVKLLGKKWSDTDRAYGLIDRIDIVLWNIAVAVILLDYIIFLIAKLFS